MLPSAPALQKNRPSAGSKIVASEGGQRVRSAPTSSLISEARGCTCGASRGLDPIAVHLNHFIPGFLSLFGDLFSKVAIEFYPERRLGEVLRHLPLLHLPPPTPRAPLTPPRLRDRGADATGASC